MVITDEIDFSAPSQPHTSGGFADIKQGQYRGFTVAVKKLRVAETDNFDKIRRVSGKDVFEADALALSSSFPSNSAKRLSFGILYLIQTS